MREVRDLQVIVPMSGSGQRFVTAGVTTPKPLLVLNGKTVLQHIVEMYPGASNFVFICRDDHLNDPRWQLAQLIESFNIPHKIISIKPHKLGPAHAVLAAEPYLESSDAAIVNYADFTCRWDFSLFLRDVSERQLAASMPAYRGFHPHSGGKTNYAYIAESDGLVVSVQEKKPFTSNKVQEYTSTGAYYFSTVELLMSYVRRLLESDLNVNGEFYLSGVFELMAQDAIRSGVFEIEHFMQWGTPEDVDEYKYWSNLFSSITDLDRSDFKIPEIGTPLFLASGLGSRFSDAGYTLAKQALPLSGSTVLAQVLKLTGLGSPVITTLKGGIVSQLDLGSNVEIVELPNLLPGQAQSALAGIEGFTSRVSGPITVFPTDTLFANKSSNIMRDQETTPRASLTVWVSPPSAISRARPSDFGWVWKTNDRNVLGHSLKKSPELNGGPALEECFVMTGAFTFSSEEVCRSLIQELISRDIRVSGELYLDSLVAIAPALGVEVKLFEPTFFASLGTPLEYESFCYWQSCFDKWESHSYNLERDPFFESQRDIQSCRDSNTRNRVKGREWSLEI